MNQVTKVVLRTAIGAVALLLAAVPVLPQTDLTDPYVILNKHVEAIGGIDAMKAQATTYVEAEITVSGLTGTVKNWTKQPTLSRQELDLKVFQQTSGDNGEYAWSMDTNGKVQIAKDEPTMKRRELAKRLANYENLDRNSDVFTLTFEGTESVGDAECYKIKTVNTLNEDVSVSYFDKQTFVMLKTTTESGQNKSQTLYTDHRMVDGVLVAFRQESLSTPGDQQVTVQTTLMEIGIEIDPALFQPPSGDARDFAFVSGNAAIDVPFVYERTHLFLKVTVGCKERLWFLDTGASISVIDSTFAAELGLEFEGDAVARGTGNTVSVKFVKLPPFSVPGIEFESQVVGAIDLKKILKKFGMDVAGILGYDFLSRFTTKIDYANRKISFYDPKEFMYDGDGVVLDAPLDDNLFTIPMTVDGKYSGRWKLDIGSGSITMHYPYAEKNGLLNRKGFESMSFGAGGGHLSRVTLCKTAELGGFVVPNPIIDMPTENVEGGFGETETVGNIGNPLFRHFNLFLDYTNQQVIVEKGADFDRVFPRGKSGLQLTYNDSEEIEVLFVPEDTPAEKAGFEVGDIVLSINGIGVEHLNGLIALGELNRADEGTTYEYRILRRGKEKKLKLKLKELY